MNRNAARSAFGDQYNAAVAHAHRALDAMADQPGARATWFQDPWIARQLADLHAALLAGTAQLCPHITTTPRVLHAAVWAPGRVVCTGCVSTLTPDATEDATCDRCRRPAIPIYPATASAGPLLLAFGLCRACLTRTCRAAA